MHAPNSGDTDTFSFMAKLIKSILFPWLPSRPRRWGKTVGEVLGRSFGEEVWPVPTSLLAYTDHYILPNKTSWVSGIDLPCSIRWQTPGTQGH